MASVLEAPVTLDRLELLELSLPRREVFTSAVGVRTEKRVLLVRWWDADGQWGIGEASCRADPFYSGEFLDGAVLMIRDHLAPLLPARGPLSAVVAACERIRGWPFATAALLSAAIDGLRRRGVPDPIDRWPGRRLRQVPAGVSLGIYADRPQTLAAVELAVQAGFRRVKLKLSPTMDPAVLPAVRAAFPGLRLSVDANGSFGAAQLDDLARLADLDLQMLEQPFPPGRLDLDQRLKARVPALPICLDEGLPDLGAAITARQLGVLDAANIKPGRVGGPLACDALLRWCRDSGVSAWIGGMFETGIGRHANLRAASCLPDAEAHDISVPSRYLVADITDPPLAMHGGLVALDDAPVTVRWDRVSGACVRRLTVRPGAR